MWDNNSGSGLGCHPTSYYGSEADNATNKEIIYQQRLRYKMLNLYIKNSLKTDAKHKLRAFNTPYTYNNQDYGATIFFVIVKIVHPNTRAGWSDIKKNLETMRMYHFKHDIPKCMNDTSISG